MTRKSCACPGPSVQTSKRARSVLASRHLSRCPRAHRRTTAGLRGCLAHRGPRRLRGHRVATRVVKRIGALGAKECADFHDRRRWLCRGDTVRGYRGGSPAVDVRRGCSPSIYHGSIHSIWHRRPFDCAWPYHHEHGVAESARSCVCCCCGICYSNKERVAWDATGWTHGCGHGCGRHQSRVISASGGTADFLRG